MASPLQIVLDTDNFRQVRVKQGGGGLKDFYAHRDKEFRQHKQALLDQIDTISAALTAQSQGAIGHIKIILRRDAWAKSHRPMKALFRPDRVRLVGGGDLGVMIVEVTPAILLDAKRQIGEAETHTTMKWDDFRGIEVPHPSVRKSETGAIDRIELYGAADRRSFSLEDAVAWLSKSVTGGSYEVELFDPPVPRSEWDRLSDDRRKLYESFVDGFGALEQGLSVQRLARASRGQPILAVRLEQSSDQPMLRLVGGSAMDRRREVAPFNPDRDKHARLLKLLDTHPLVRRIELPGIIVRSDSEQPAGAARPTLAAIPIRDTRRSHPRMGIIDGGIGPALSDWVIDRWDVLAEEDADPAHGTFIGGLGVVGGTLNGLATCPEPDGVELFDLAVFPTEERADSFATYYPGGLPQFFDELNNAVADACARHDVRVFNMSLNVVQPVTPERYSMHASRLDQIAEENNAIIFVSAGNTAPQDLRAEWPVDESAALSSLALARNDGLLTPGESSRNVTVAALNPPVHSGCVPYAPSRFSRRGPGLRSGVKPDLAHVGGAGTLCSARGHGLFSILPDGNLVDGCGTSYAAPLVAKTAAMLNHSIEGEVSRETLIGLLVHSASLPQALQSEALRPVARHLVGFGIPPSATEILETGDHEITLVFASRIMPGQQINFRFSWPASLVGPNGQCSGRAKLTLVSTPPLDARFGSEFVRVNVNAVLQQEQADDHWKGRLDPLYLPGKRERHAIEAELIEHDLKWSPVKVFEKTFKRGVGRSSNWRLFVDYLTRAGEEMPEEGVPFTAILTISDPKSERPVFNDLRQSLRAIGTRIADIRTAARITPRV